MTATWKGAAPLRNLAKRWDAKRRQRDFDRTITHAEQTAVRRAIEKSQAIPMKHNERAAVMKWANLWFRHRHSADFVAPGYEALAKALKIGERTVIKIVAWAEDHGFLIRLGGGNGRGDKVRWGISIKRIMEVLAPNFAASNGIERITADGEILINRKGENRLSPIRELQRGKRLASPYRTAADLFHAGSWTTVRFLAGLITRLGQGYTPRPIQPPSRQAHQRADFTQEN